MIYMDKMLKEGMLIQAMSITNRTYNRNSKPHGKVRFYRQGNDIAEQETTEQEIKGLEKDDILAKPQSHQILDLESAVVRLKELSDEHFGKTPRG